MDCQYYIFRNFTVEPLFSTIEGCRFSGYNGTDFKKNCNNYVWFYQLPLRVNVEVLTSEINFYLQQFQYLIKTLPANSNIICFTLTDMFRFKFMDSDNRLDQSIQHYNNALYELSQEDFRIKVIDICEFTNKYSLQDLYDARHYYMAQMILSPGLSNAFANWFSQKIRSFNSVRKKCLILDLDNTLWGGILGEDGVEGIKIGNNYPGNCYADFQNFILEMKNNGVILAVCSKNNLADVKEAFSKRVELNLKLNDFATYRINWNDKPQNIIDIAKELNIGIDSMVFVDDNPVERELAKKTLPGLSVPEFEKTPYKLMKFAKKIYHDYFAFYKLTDEDKNKSQQYVQISQRKNSKLLFTSKEDFIQSLNIVVTIYEANKINIPRIAQMTQKTNQFNLTTKRYNEAELYGLMQKNHKIWCASVKDKFGDSGITVVTIVKIEKSTAVFDSFLLSCRVLGLGIEKVFLNYLINRLFDMDIKTIKAVYIPTSKNKQVANFYEDNDFLLLSVDKNKEKHYQFEIKTKKILPKYYRIIKA